MALVHRGLVTEEDGEEFVELYAGAMDAKGIVVGQSFGFHPWCAQDDIPPEWPAAHTRLRHQDPSLEFFARNPAGTPFVISSLFGEVEAKREIFHELTHVSGFVDGMVQRFSTSWGDAIHVVVYRKRGQRRFSADDTALASLLHPHVAGALSTRSALAAIERPGSPAKVRADGDAYVAFPSLDVVLSPRAERTWTRELGPQTPVGWQRVRRLVARAALEFLHGVPGARSRKVYPTLRAELSWVPPAAGETHRALVLFFREAAKEPTLAAPFAELLSPTQRRVAELAAGGATNPQIARTLGVSLETVRTHVREVFRRLGVSRRSELGALFGSRSPT